jgi:hypothetical protein
MLCDIAAGGVYARDETFIVSGKVDFRRNWLATKLKESKINQVRESIP